MLPEEDAPSTAASRTSSFFARWLSGSLTKPTTEEEFREKVVDELIVGSNRETAESLEAKAELVHKWKENLDKEKDETAQVNITVKELRLLLSAVAVLEQQEPHPDYTTQQKDTAEKDTVNGDIPSVICASFDVTDEAGDLDEDELQALMLALAAEEGLYHATMEQSPDLAPPPNMHTRDISIQTISSSDEVLEMLVTLGGGSNAAYANNLELHKPSQMKVKDRDVSVRPVFDDPNGDAQFAVTFPVIPSWPPHKRPPGATRRVSVQPGPCPDEESTTKRLSRPGMERRVSVRLNGSETVEVTFFPAAGGWMKCVELE